MSPLHRCLSRVRSTVAPIVLAATVLAVPTVNAAPATAALPACRPQASAARGADPDDLARALSRWHRAWASEKLELAGFARKDGETDPRYGRGLLPAHEPAQLTHERAFAMLCERARELQSPDVARRLVLLASVGLDDRGYDFTSAPFTVRRIARAALARLTDAASLDAVLRASRGETDGFRSAEFSPAVQAAALRGLGDTRRGVFRPAIEAQLGNAERVVRLAAAESARDLAHPRSLDAMRLRLHVEADGAVAQVLVEAIQRVLDHHTAEVDTAAARRAISTAVEAIGRTDWRTDLAVVELVARYRTAVAVEPLIGILARFVERPDAVAAGKLSGILRHRTYEVLGSLTGALIPIDRPDDWRAFWERERGAFQLAAPREPSTSEARTTTGFFGIPVFGSRVAFVIDTSGSMRAPYRPLGDARTGGRDAETASRLEWAKHELMRTVEALPADAHFNVIAFAGDVQRWREAPVPNSPRARTALRERLGALSAEGGTNIFGALQSALEFRDVRYGQRNETGVDEVFLLSDGEPSAGDVVVPKEIVELITEINRFDCVRIHTVYMGGADSWFMQRLAAQNGGRYVRL